MILRKFPKTGLFYILSNVRVKFHRERKSDVLLVIRSLSTFCKKPVSPLILCDHFIFFFVIIFATFGKDKSIVNSHQLVFNPFEIMKLTNFTCDNSFEIMKVTNFTCETSKEMYILNQFEKRKYN